MLFPLLRCQIKLIALQGACQLGAFGAGGRVSTMLESPGGELSEPSIKLTTDHRLLGAQVIIWTHARLRLVPDVNDGRFNSALMY